MLQLYPLVYHGSLVLSLYDYARWIMLHFKEKIFIEKCELSEASQCLAVIIFFRTHPA
jgi:hypothetical protein